MRGKFSSELKVAMKAGEKRRVGTIRMIMAALKGKDIEARGQGKTVSDEDILALLQKMTKSRKESQEIYEKAGRVPKLGHLIQCLGLTATLILEGSPGSSADRCIFQCMVIEGCAHFRGAPSASGPFALTGPHCQRASRSCAERCATMIEIANMADLASRVFQLYNLDTPIEIIRAAQNNNFARPTYFVLLAGTEFELTRSNSAFTDITTAMHQVSAYDIAVLQAIRGAIPENADIILVGHSLGGMTAQVVAQDLWKWGDTRITRIITFGSPTTTLPLPEIAYTRYAVEGDPIPLIPIPGIPQIKQIVVDNGGKLPEMIVDHLSYPGSRDLAVISPLGDEGKFQPLYLDAGTDQYFTAPNLPIWR